VAEQHCGTDDAVRLQESGRLHPCQDMPVRGQVPERDVQQRRAVAAAAVARLGKVGGLGASGKYVCMCLFRRKQRMKSPSIGGR
jgi:hypothetical protein